MSLNPANTGPALSQKNLFANTMVADKLQEVENKLKSKFGQIQKLEGKLEQLLAQCRSQSASVSQQQPSCNSMATGGHLSMDSADLYKLVATIKRVISKLKIELH